MNPYPHSAWTAAGWTMLHLVWLGGLIGAIGAAARFLMRKARPEARYAAALLFLGMLAVAPMALFARLYQPIAALPPIVAESAKTGAKASSIGLEPMRLPKLARETVAARPSPVTASPPRWDSLVARLPWLWLIGSTTTLGLLGVGLAGVGRMRRSSRALLDGDIAALARRLADSLGMARRVGVAVCDRIVSPVLLGVLRPMILLPTSALSGWTTDELEMALLHELAHLRRHDNLVNLLQCLVEAILFFHPAAWWLSSWVRLERELCCDRLVVEKTGRSRAYATLLASLVGVGRRNVAVSALAEKPIVTRIRKILNKEDRPMRLTMPEGFGLIAAAVVAGALAIGVRAGVAGDSPQQTKPSNETQRKALRAMAESAAAVTLDTKNFDARGAALLDIARAQAQIGDREGARATIRQASRALYEGADQAKVPAILAAIVVQMRAADAWLAQGEPALAREALDLATKSMEELITDPKLREALAQAFREHGIGDTNDPVALEIGEMGYTLIEARIALGDIAEARRLIAWCVERMEGLKGVEKPMIDSAMGGMLVRAGDKPGGLALLRKAEAEIEALAEPARPQARQYLMRSLAECGEVDEAFARLRSLNEAGRSEALDTVLDAFQQQDDDYRFAWVDPGGLKILIGAPATKPKGTAAVLRSLAAGLRTMDDLKAKARSLATVAHLLAKSKESKAAIEAAEAIPALSRRDYAGPSDGFYDAVKPATFARIAEEMAKAGDKAGAAGLFDRAGAMTRAIVPADQKLIALIVLAKAQVGAGDHLTGLATVREAIDLAKAQAEPLRSRSLAMLVEARCDAGDTAGSVAMLDAIRAYPPAEKSRALLTLSVRFAGDGDAASSRDMSRLRKECHQAPKPEGFKLGPVMNLNAVGRDTFLDPELEFPNAWVNVKPAAMMPGATLDFTDLTEAERAARALPAATRGDALMMVAARVAAKGDFDGALRIAATIEDAHGKLSTYQLIAGQIRGAKSIAIVARR